MTPTLTKTAILFLISLTSSSVMANYPSEKEMMEAFTQKTQLFSANLLTAINEENPEKNLIFSPLGIQTCLAMAYAGAKEKTAEEMYDGLQLVSRDRNVVGQSFKHALNKHQNNEALKIANKFYLKKGYKVTSAFKKIATDDFYSDTENLDFSENQEAAKIMNNWVSEKTSGKIQDLISSDSLNEDTRLVLCNAIYFKAAWVNKFEKDSTVKEDFWLNDTSKIKVDMMNTKGKFMFGVYPELDATALEMRYKNGFSMFIILPNTKTGLKKLQNKLKPVNLFDLRAKMIKSEVTVKLPKFKATLDIKLKSTLTKMGMGTMFTNDANFGDLLTSPQPLQIDEVVHQARIEVNEEGSEAAAATAAIIRMKRSINFPHPEPKEFIADHPLYYAIIDNEKSILFSGYLRLLKENDCHDEL